MPIVLDIEPGSSEWHLERHKDVTASDVQAFYDPSAYKTELALYYEKRQPNPPMDKNVDHPLYIRLEAGKALEPIVAKLFERRTGVALTKNERYYRHSTTPRFGATPDYFHPSLPLGSIIREVGGHEHLQAPITNEDGPGVVEIKTDVFGHNSDEPPIKYLAQLQAQLSVCALKWGMVITLVDMSYITWTVYRADPYAINDMTKKVTEFWEKVEKGIQPKPATNDLQTIKMMFPDIVDQAVDLSDNHELFQACESYMDIHRIKTQYEASENVQKNIALQIAGAHRKVICGPFVITRSEYLRTPRLKITTEDGKSVTFPERMFTDEHREIVSLMNQHGQARKTIRKVVYEYTDGIKTTAARITERA